MEIGERAVDHRTNEFRDKATSLFKKLRKDSVGLIDFQEFKRAMKHEPECRFLLRLFIVRSHVPLSR